MDPEGRIRSKTALPELSHTEPRMHPLPPTAPIHPSATRPLKFTLIMTELSRFFGFLTGERGCPSDRGRSTEKLTPLHYKLTFFLDSPRSFRKCPISGFRHSPWLAAGFPHSI